MTGRVKVGAKVEKIKRKRFYLFRGGLAENKPLVDRIKTATPTSRNCFYCNAQASPDWSHGWRPRIVNRRIAGASRLTT